MADQPLKICTKCKIEKSLDDFSKLHVNKDGKHTQCKKCLQIYRSNHYFKNDEYRKKRISDASKRNRERKYGVTEDEFEKLLAAQNYCCAICSVHLNGSKFSLKGQLDHCHLHGTIRGILCGQCNTALGLFKDDITILTEALSYLSRFK